MKRTIERITRTAMLAVAIMLCATNAWAATVTTGGNVEDDVTVVNSDGNAGGYSWNNSASIKLKVPVSNSLGRGALVEITSVEFVDIGTKPGYCTPSSMTIMGCTATRDTDTSYDTSVFGTHDSAGSWKFAKYSFAEGSRPIMTVGVSEYVSFEFPEGYTNLRALPTKQNADNTDQVVSLNTDGYSPCTRIKGKVVAPTPYTATPTSSSVNISKIEWTRSKEGNDKAGANYIIDATNLTTLNLDESFAANTIFIDKSSSGTITINQSNSSTLSATNIVISSGLIVNFGENTSLSVVGGTVAGSNEIGMNAKCTFNFRNVYCPARLNVRGTLNASGNTYFTAANPFQVGCKLNVVDGVTELTNRTNGNDGFSGNIDIAEGAKLTIKTTDGLAYNRANRIDVHGTLEFGGQTWTIGRENTIYLHNNGLIKGAGGTNGAMFYNVGDGTINVDGNSTIESVINVRGNTLTLNIAEGKTLTWSGGSKATTGGIKKTGLGTLDVTAATSYTGATTVTEGMMIQTSLPSGNVSIGKDCTFTLQNCDWTSGDNKFSGTGTLELKAMDKYHTYSAANSFGGTLKFATSTSAYIQYSASFANISGTPEMVLECGTESDQKKWQFGGWEDGTHSMNVKNLSGFAQIYPNFNQARAFAFNTLQTKNTTFSGTFTQYSNSSYPTLVVRGENEADSVYSLTLTKANTTTGSLTVQDNAKVVFSSTGSWAAGTVTVADGGYLEVTNSSSVASTLDLQSGGTIKIATYTTTETVGEEEVETLHTRTITAGTVTFPDSGEAAIDISAIPDLGENETATIITASTSLDNDITKLRLVGKPYSLQVNGNSLEVINDGGLKWDSVNGWGAKDVTKYSDATIAVSSASDTVTLTADMKFDTLTITGSGTVSFSSTDSETISVSNISIPAGVTVVTADGMEISGDVTGGGIINVPANTTLTMDGVTTSGDTLADRVKVAVSGTLKTKGTTTLSAANTSAAGSLIEVVNGVTTLSSSFRGLSGNITIQSDGELKFAASYNASGKDQGWDYLGTSSSNTVKVYGTLNMPNCNLWLRANNTLELYQGAEVLGSGYYASYGSLIWAGNASLKAYGDAEINATITTVTDCSPVFNVEENKTLTISTAFIGQAVEITSKPTQISGGSITKAGAGTLDLTAITPTKPITINAGKVVADEVPTATITINENGTFVLKDKEWAKGNADCFRGSGTLELYAATREYGHNVEGVSFSGIVKVSNVTGKQNNFTGTAAMFASAPEFILDADNTHLGGGYYDNNDEHPFEVKNLSGSGKFKSQWNGDAHSYIIKTTQTKDTVFSGSFESNHSTGDRVMNLTVVGDGSGTVHSLTLTKGQNTSDTDTAEAASTLKVSDGAKVVFTSTGGWGNGNVLVGDDGYLECTNNAAVKKLALNDGATLVFPTSSSCLSEITSITFSSGTVAVSYPSEVTPTSGTKLINWSAAPAGSFVFDGDTPAYKEDNGTYYVLTKDEDGLYIREAVAVAMKGGVTYHATVAEAIAAAGNDGLGSVVIIKSTTENIVYDKTKVTLSRLSTDITTGTIDPGPEYNAVPGTDQSLASYPYTYTNKATTYYWTDADQNDHNWSTPGNWVVDAENEPTATRAPTSIDSVVFNDGASVSCSAASVSCAGMTINGNVTLTGADGQDITLGGNITGSGVLTLDNACLKNSLAEAITVAGTVEVLFTKDSEIAASQSVGIRFNGPVSISDTIKTWDAVHTVAGTTTLNGDFTKAGGNFGLTLGDVVVSGNTALTISKGSITISGAVAIADGATFTIPASGLTVGDSASFVLAGRSSVLVDNGSGASGKVRTSLTDGAKVISSTTAGVTTYKVVYGTIFSVW